MIADDFPGIKPRLHVAVGQEVRRGELLCEDAAQPGERHTAPGAGRVESINRGARRALHSIVIALSESDQAGAPSVDEMDVLPTSAEPDTLGPSSVRDVLVESGMWKAFRTRPLSRVPHPESVPRALFVTAIDTNPLAADPDVVLEEARADFELGLRGIAKLSGGETYLRVRAGSSVGLGIDAPVTVEEFAGPHPAGTAGVHIHLLEPVGRDRTVWTIGYQDVVSIGRLLRRGLLDVRRIIAIGGPPVADPRLVRTRAGASIRDLTRKEDVGEGCAVDLGLRLVRKGRTR